MDRPLAESLKRTAICAALTDAERDAIAAIAERVTYLPGEDLFGEGDAGDGLYLVIAGEIDVLKRTPNGERSLARLGPGGVLGEMSLLTDDARSATGRALGETSVLRLPAAPFRALLGEGSSAALKVVAGIAEVLATRVANMNAKMLELAEKAEKAQPDAIRTENLVQLHRMLQVWSF
jgi:CRP-like cAMP-binding protein